MTEEVPQPKDAEELEAYLYAPDLVEDEDGTWERDVEHYDFPDSTGIQDSYAASVWEAAKKMFDDGETDEEETDEEAEEMEE